MSILYTAEETIDRLHRIRGRISSAISLLNNLKIQRGQMIKERMTIPDMVTELAAHRGDIKTITTQIKADILTIDTVIGVDPTEVFPGMVCLDTGGATLEIHHIKVTTTTLIAQDASGAAMVAFAGFTALDRIEIVGAENPQNNGVFTISTVASNIITIGAIPGGIANDDDESMHVRLLEVLS